MNVRSDPSQTYTVAKRRSTNSTIEDENRIIENARSILYRRMKRLHTGILHSPETVREFLSIQLCDREHEVGAFVFMDNRHCVIQYKEMFRGTVDGASIHPREVLKEALFCNACAVIMVHNHPSGIAVPSEADRKITAKIKETLAMVEVRLLDHFIVGGLDEFYSFAENGML